MNKRNKKIGQEMLRETMMNNVQEKMVMTTTRMTAIMQDAAQNRGLARNWVRRSPYPKAWPVTRKCKTTITATGTTTRGKARM